MMMMELFEGIIFPVKIKYALISTISELLPAQGGQVKTSKFLMEVVDILVDYIRKNNDRSCKVNLHILTNDDKILTLAAPTKCHAVVQYCNVKITDIYTRKEFCTVQNVFNLLQQKVCKYVQGHHLKLFLVLTIVEII